MIFMERMEVAQEGMVAMLIMACLLIVALSKWAVYKISLMAVLLYYGEKGMGFPTGTIMKEYQIKVVKRMLGIKGD